MCVFDGLQNVTDRCVSWYEDKLSAEKAGELVREDAKEHGGAQPNSAPETTYNQSHSTALPEPLASMPEGVQIIESEAITDRKSAFVGRACKISHPSQVLKFTFRTSRQSRSRCLRSLLFWRILCQIGGYLALLIRSSMHGVAKLAHCCIKVCKTLRYVRYILIFTAFKITMTMGKLRPAVDLLICCKYW